MIIIVHCDIFLVKHISKVFLMSIFLFTLFFFFSFLGTVIYKIKKFLWVDLRSDLVGIRFWQDSAFHYVWFFNRGKIIYHNEGKQNRYAEGVSMFCFFYSIRPKAFWQESRWWYSLFSHASQNEKRICLSKRVIWYVAKLWNECKILSWQFEHLKGGFAKGKSGYRNDTGTKGQGLAALCSGSRIWRGTCVFGGISVEIDKL